MKRILIHACLAFVGAFMMISCDSTNSADQIIGTIASTPVSSGPTGLTLNIVGGNNQTGAAGATFSDPLRVQLLSSGKPVSGLINFTTVSGSVAFSASSSNTDSAGMVQTYVTAGMTSGTVTVRATYNSLQADFTLIVASQTNATLTKISGDVQSASVGTTLALPLIVETRDANTGNPLSNILVRFSVVSGNGRLNSSSNTVTISSDGTGRASVNFDAGTVAGANSVTAIVVSVPTQNTSFSSTGVVPTTSVVSVAQSTVTTAVATLVADGSQTTTATLTTKDIYGNTIPTGGKTVTFTTTVGTIVGSPVDHGNGTYTQIVRVPADNSTATMNVSGTVGGVALTSTPAPILLSSGTLSLAQSTVNCASNSVSADGSSLVLCTIALKDNLGNQQTSGGQTVSIATTLGSLVGSVTDVGNGTYTQTLKAGTISGNAIVSASVGGAGAITQTKTVTFLAGTPDDTKSTIVTTPSTLLPNGTSSSIITVQLRDTNGNISAAATARTVTLTKTGGTWMGSGLTTVTATSNNDGTYFAILTTASATGNSVITATDNTTILSKTATVYFTNGSYGPNVSTSLVQVSNSNPVVADGVATVTVTVTLKDSFYSQLTSGGSNVVITSTAGTLQGSVVDHGDGTYTQVLKSPSASAIATISATVDSNAITKTATASFYGTLSLAQSSISASPSSVVANGTATTVVYLTAKDASGIAIPAGGATGIVFATTFGTFTGSLTDNGNGTYSQVLQSPSSAHVATVSAAQSSNAFSATTTVSFYTANNLAGLTIDCSNISTYQNTTIVVSSGTLTMNTNGPSGYCPNSFTFAGVVLQNSAVLTHTATTLTQEYGLEFTANYVTIDSTSSIDVTNKGYPASTAGNSRIRTQGNVDVNTGNSSPRLGGSYGGSGSDTGGVGYVPINATYGSLFQPFDLGSSGSNNGGNPGSGGGKIKITITGQAGLANTGVIRANSGVPADNSGSGSGGSIWINTTVLTGTGTIAADGGRWSTQTNVNNQSGGGGGRIALYYTAGSNSGSFSYPTGVLANITAKGGLNYGGCLSGAGTVYLKSSAQTYGDLIIDNKGASTCNAYTAGTVLNSPTITASQSVSATSLTNTGAFADSYVTTSPYVGYYVDPNIAQNATPKKADNQLYKITAATANAITTTGGDMTSVAAVGNTYEFVLQFDNFEIGDNTPIAAGNLRIVSYGGDLRSNDTITATMTGTSLPAGIEYVGLQTLTVGLGALTQPQLLVENLGTTNFSISGGTFNLTSLISGNFSTNSMTLNGGKITSSGSVTLTTTNGTLGALVGNNAITAAGVFSVTGNSTIAQTATTSTQEYSLEVSASGINVGSGSTLTSLGKGFVNISYPVNRVFGNQNAPAGWTGTTSNRDTGGSHGGRGGGTNYNTFSSEVYGSYLNPYTSGGSAVTTGSGGGIIRLVATNTGSVNIDGTIDSRGQATTSWGGAGGSIYVSGGALSGAGAIDASGGSNTTYVGGGGGRVAVYYTSLAGNFTYPTNALANVRAYGGIGQTSGGNIGPSSGAPGTVFMKSNSETYGKLIINNNNILGFENGNHHTVFSFPTVVASTSVTYNSGTGLSTLTANSSFGEAYGASGAYVGMYLNPNIAQNATVKVADDTQFKIVAQTANTLTVQGNITAIAAAGNSFQVNMKLDGLKVVNNSILEVDNGVIQTTDLDVTNSEIEGTGSVESYPTGATTLSANGGTINLNGVTPSTGALTLTSGIFVLSTGGTFNVPGNLTVTSSTISGTNVGVSVGGALSLTASTLNAGAVTTTSDLSLGTASIANVSGNISVGGALTVNGSSTLTQAVGQTLSTTGNLNVTNTGTLTSGMTNVGGNLTVDTTSTMSSSNRVLTPFTTYNTVSNLNVSGSTSITNGSTLTTPTTNSNEEYYLYLTTPNLMLDSTSFIQVDGKGYHCKTSTNFHSLGNADSVGYNGNTVAAQMFSGGSYGGFGGTANAAHFTGKPYGSFSSPIYIGTSGACVDGATSNDPGGGAIRIAVSGTSTINGTISAGAYNLNGPSDTGAGGSVMIQTGTLAGSGLIRANGAQNSTNAYYGSGSGGRVAVYYTTASGSWATGSGKVAGLQAFGGYSNSNSSAAYNRGGAGTIYLKADSQTYGDMIINNNNPTSTQDSVSLTPLFVPLATASSSLTATTFTAPSAFSNVYGNVANFFAGFYLNPNVAQNATAKLSDDSLFLISSNTGTTITTASGDLTSIASAGNTFSVVAVFDNFEVKGRAKVTGGYVRVMSGDLSSNDNVTFSQDGSINLTELDLGSGVTWNTTSNSGGTVTQKCAANYSCP